MPRHSSPSLTKVLTPRLIVPGGDIYRERLERIKFLDVETIHGGYQEAFGKQRILEIIEDYLSGSMVLGDPVSWVEQ